MKLIIDIPDSIYEGVKLDRILDTSIDMILESIKDGTPLEAQPTYGSTSGGVSWGGIYKEKAQPTDADSSEFDNVINQTVKKWFDKRQR